MKSTKASKPALKVLLFVLCFLSYAAVCGVAFAAVEPNASAASQAGADQCANGTPAVLAQAVQSCTPANPPSLVVAAVEVLGSEGSCMGVIARRLGYKPGKPTWKPADVDCKWAESGDMQFVDATGQLLVGAGDVIVAVGADNYRQAMLYQMSGTHQLRVFFNGVNVTDDLERVGAQQLGDYYFVQYHLKPGAQSRKLWSSMIRNSHSMLKPATLNVSYGWNDGDPTSISADTMIGAPRIAVSEKSKLWFAALAVTAFLMLGLALASKTSVLRDRIPASIMQLIPAAEALRQGLRNSPAEATPLKQATYAAYGQAGADDLACVTYTQAVLADPIKFDSSKTGAITIGLASMEAKYLSEALARQMSYSLGRVQLFCWFIFALLSGIFLRIVYTQFPPLDDSILTLLGISSGTSVVSLVVDRTADQGAASKSKGLLLDLLTGPNNDYQLHRLLAVLVNLTLLGIGIAHIFTSIAYPTFDQSWLVFLTISGATFAAGKQLTEKTPAPGPA